MEIRVDNVIINIDQQLIEMEKHLIEFNAEILNMLLKEKESALYCVFIAGLETTLNCLHTWHKLKEKE
jgi:hypothetical protein